MKLIEIFKEKSKLKKPVISFEIFPPKVNASEQSVNNLADSFSKLKPDFISVTFGAGGSSKGRTVELVSMIQNTYHTETMAHFTSVGFSLEDVDRVLNELKANNIHNILALRGDPPKNQPGFDFNKNVFSYAAPLIEYVNGRYDFGIAAAAYPEGHIECEYIKNDIMHLKEKTEKGVDFLVTQLFFDNRIFYNFLDQIRAAGITCPVTPGIMPVFRVDQIKTIASLCGASIPAKLIMMFEKYQDNPADVRKAGIEYASEQIRHLLENKVDGIHLLTMNKSDVAKEILMNVAV